jgi:hypothetical protein
VTAAGQYRFDGPGPGQAAAAFGTDDSRDQYLTLARPCLGEKGPEPFWWALLGQRSSSNWSNTAAASAAASGETGPSSPSHWSRRARRLASLPRCSTCSANALFTTADRRSSPSWWTCSTNPSSTVTVILRLAIRPYYPCGAA